MKRTIQYRTPLESTQEGMAGFTTSIKKQEKIVLALQPSISPFLDSISSTTQITNPTPAAIKRALAAIKGVARILKATAQRLDVELTITRRSFDLTEKGVLEMADWLSLANGAFNDEIATTVGKIEGMVATHDEFLQVLSDAQKSIDEIVELGQQFSQIERSFASSSHKLSLTVKNMRALYTEQQNKWQNMANRLREILE